MIDLEGYKEYQNRLVRKDTLMEVEVQTDYTQNWVCGDLQEYEFFECPACEEDNYLHEYERPKYCRWCGQKVFLKEKE